MLDYLKGVLAFASPTCVTVEVSNLGRRLFIPLSTYTQLPPLGDPILLYVSVLIRENSHRNYGFIARETRDLFEKLSDISGIGPKTSLALIGHLDTSALHCAIASADTLTLAKVPGIGKKTAERLIIELRDTLPIAAKTSQEKGAYSGELTPKEARHQDAIYALVRLGYSHMQAQQIIKKTLHQSSKADESLSELLKAALKIASARS